MKITLVLKGAKDFFERQPVYIRWSEGQKRTFKKTSLLLTKDQYTRFLAHSHLPKEKDLYQRFLNAFEEKAAAPPKDFFHYVDACMSEWENDKRPETMRQLRGEKSKLKKFRERLLLTEITPVFLKEYKAYCYSIGNQTNTVWKSFKFLRLIIRKAQREKLVSENPFEIFEMPRYKDTQKVWLTQSQIDSLEKINNLPDEILFARDWFVIGCYTGLRYGDMAAFDKKKHIKDERLTLYTSKTGEAVSMPLTDKIKGLLKKVDYKPIPYTNTHFNRLLKQIDIGVSLNVHLARHSAAVRWANLGVSQEVVAKLLGHTNLKTTAIYFKLTGHRIDEELLRNKAI